MTQYFIRLLAVVFVCVGLSNRSKADSYPTHTITILVGFTAGSGTDIIARILAKELSVRLGQPVIVENKSGASTILAMSKVARAMPDGYTLLLNSNVQTTLPATEESLPFDVINDFTQVARLVSGPVLLVANSKFQPNTIEELIELAKSKPGYIKYADAGPGTLSAIGMDLFKMKTGTNVKAVSYRGSPPALTDIAAGVVDLYLGSFAGAAPFLESGAIKPIGISSAKVPDFVRAVHGMENIKTIAEQGVPGYDVEIWYGLFAPAKLPPDILQRLQTEISEILRVPSVHEALLKIGVEPDFMGSDKFSDYVRSDLKLWKDVQRSVVADPK